MKSWWWRAVVAGALSCAAPGAAVAQAIGTELGAAPAMPLEPLGNLVLLEQVIVSDDSGSPDFDPTGLDSDEVERVEAPFGSDLLFEVAAEDVPAGELDFELGQASGASPVEAAMGGDRLNLRGFPTPMRRNGFTQSGFPEVINAERAEIIIGALTPITGRAAPGGIRNFHTQRPRGRVGRQVRAAIGTDNRWRVEAKDTGVVVPKKAWHAVTVGARGREGPQRFAEESVGYVSAALAVKHSRSTSTLWQFDWFRYDGNPSPATVEYRETPTSRIVGPYRPLVDFHAFGPNAGVRRDVGSLSAQLDSQLRPDLSLRAAAQWFGRDIVQDRFTTGQYVLSTGKFSGTREPRHIEQSFDGGMLQADLTWRFAALNADHKLLFGFESTWVRGDNDQRALPIEARNALPVSAREFDPEEPDYSRPEYDPGFYARIITDRRDEVLFSALVVNSRTALQRGRTVFTTGLRQDFVNVDVSDGRPEATQSRVEDSTARLTFHAGANHTIVEGRALLFANVSSAFEPSTRVDARTGEIQGNESTSGYEMGTRALLFNRRMSVSATVFQFFNDNIARRNPLYDDPVADADQRQPQLVSSGAERFTGGAIAVGVRPNEAWSLTSRIAYTRAVTTASPDVPEEVGRALTRLPALTATSSVRHRWSEGPLDGFSCGASLVYLGNVVAHYANAVREHLEFPDYALVGLNVGYALKRGKYAWDFRVNVSNALNRDLVDLLARPGAGRHVGAECQLRF
jgi:hypothetical protein